MTTINVYDESNAPSFAKHSSTFKNDERCYEVHFVVGDTHDEVLSRITSIRMRDKTLIDYDVNYSLEGDKWVGVTCRDF